jgi:signal recognition particle GTPase
VKEKAWTRRFNHSSTRTIVGEVSERRTYKLMGGDVAGINLWKPTVILMSGLQGSGETTFSGKLKLSLN